MVTLEGKELAELRNKEIKEMLLKLEKQRDLLYDEIANRKGRVEIMEEIIREIYNRILDVNKEVQQQELQEVKEAVEEKARKDEEKAKKEKEAAKEKKKADFKKFEEAKRGIKTPRPKKRKRAKKVKKD